MKAKILLINGSPRKYGASTKLMAIAKKGVVDAGGEPEELFLEDYTIKECIGCVSDDQRICRFPCIIGDDDFNMIGKKMLTSDGFVLVSPIYWYSVPGKVKNFIDRLTSLENMVIHTGRSLLEGKVAGFIVTGNDSGSIYAISQLMVTFNSMGIHIPAWALAYHHTADDVLEDEQAVRDSYNVGYIVTLSAKELSHIKEWYRANIDLKELREIAVNEVDKYLAHRDERRKLFDEHSR